MSTSNADSHPNIVPTVAALRAQVENWRQQGLTISFAPTMGALHKGHLSLVTRGKSIADRTIASIFVNPKQFAPGEDLATYPRDHASDVAQLEKAGCDLVYLPNKDEIYPPGYQTSVTVTALSDGLCGTSRPHFFGGVATVVCKLLNQCRPDFAIFGEKDFQQLLIIKRMVRDLDMDIEVVGAPIVREPDGLAMSSRNAYLGDEERKIAGFLNVVLQRAAEKIQSGENIEDVLFDARQELENHGFDDLDYFEVRSSEDLTPIEKGKLKTSARLFAAAMVGKTRLIDNWPI